MYRFSRAIYRELVEDIIDGSSPGTSGVSNRECVLRACEATVERLGRDRYSFARPARRLILDIRPYFPLAAQARMRRVVEHYIASADEFLTLQFSTGFDLAGHPLACRALTRRSVPCQRVPLAHNGYCPSHQHLADEVEQLVESRAA
jgi:hypothetical protein